MESTKRSGLTREHAAPSAEAAAAATATAATKAGKAGKAGKAASAAVVAMTPCPCLVGCYYGTCSTQ